MPKAPPSASTAPREPGWLDRLPAEAALPAALPLGFALGWGLLALLPWPLALPLFALALFAAIRLSLLGQPLLAGERSPARPRGARRRQLVPDDWWVPIPAGGFAMGSPDGEPGRYDTEGPVHWVQLSAFECLRFPVTRGLARRASPWPFRRDDRMPLVQTTWHDAIALCNRFSAAEGLRPCYRIEGDDVHWDRDADGWRLLTEAEWEYACRAGTRTRWSFGDDEAELGEYAWYGKNSGRKLQPVGRKRPNPWGLHDMHGLVYEWCWDRFGSYEAAESVDPVGPASGSSRVLRGGAFLITAGLLRSAFRNWFRPSVRGQRIGFRCARAPRRQLDP